jgi:hypothetical protein
VLFGKFQVRYLNVLVTGNMQLIGEMFPDAAGFLLNRNEPEEYFQLDAGVS